MTLVRPRSRRPIRLLHVDSAREWRGGQNQVRLLVARLAEQDGVEQAVAGRRGSRLLREAAGLGAEAVPVPWGPALDPRAVVRLASRTGRADVVHAHTSHALQAVLLALAASGADARLVASRRVAGRPRSPAVWRRADLVLPISSPVRDGLAAAGVDRARLRVVPSGVDPSELRPQRPGRLREASGAPKGTRLVGTLGALEPGKGHDVFLRAAARVARARSGVRFVVAGDGPARRRLEAQVRELGLGERTSLPGHVPDAARSLVDLDVFVLCSRREGLGTAALEAMAVGVPTVVSRAGGLVEVAGDAVPAVPTEDPGALAREIVRLLDDDEARGRVAAAGRRRVEARFTAGRTADRTLDAYRDVVAWHRRRRRHARRLEHRAAFRRARPPRPAPGVRRDGSAGPRDGRDASGGRAVPDSGRRGP